MKLEMEIKLGVKIRSKDVSKSKGEVEFRSRNKSINRI
jgi:hypothetical protein